MREQIDTIPINDAFSSGDECPFCFLERKAEQSAIRYIAGPGASYMEPDARAVTDKVGFCTVHMKKLYDYGNMLGAALMLQTHMVGLMDELEQESLSLDFSEKKSLFSKKTANPDPYWARLAAHSETCCICDKIAYNMNRYYHTFFYMLRDPEFRTVFENSKGVCLRHFGQMLQRSEPELRTQDRQWFYETAYRVTLENLRRVKADLDWFVAKHDYRNTGADWKNARDAVPRAMEKVQGLHPADPVYKEE